MIIAADASELGLVDGAVYNAILATTIVSIALAAPVRRLAGRDLPIPYSKELERQVIPQEEDIVREARRLVRGRADGA